MCKVPWLLYHHHKKVTPSYPLCFQMWKVVCLVSPPLCHTVLSQITSLVHLLFKTEVIHSAKWQKKNTYLALLFSPSTSASSSHGFNNTSAVCWQKICLERLRNGILSWKHFCNHHRPQKTLKNYKHCFLWGVEIILFTHAIFLHLK